MCVPIHCGTTKKLEEHFQNTFNSCGTFAGSWLMFESLSRLFQGMEKGEGEEERKEGKEKERGEKKETTTREPKTKGTGEGRKRDKRREMIDNQSNKN